jgi:hypothetical protein
MSASSALESRIMAVGRVRTTQPGTGEEEREMSSQPDFTIALATQRVVEHREWAARQRLVASVRTPRRRRLLQALTRIGERPAPIALPMPSLAAK